MNRSVRAKVISLGIMCCSVAVCMLMPNARAQENRYLDPAHDSAILGSAPVSKLTEELIWTKGDAAALNPALQASVRGQNDKTEPHTFRAHFRIATVPPQATLYIAGPRSATVVLNGRQVLRFEDDAKLGRGFHVMTASVADALRTGENVIAVQAVRGHSSLHTGAGPLTNQVTYGEVLLVKIVPRGIAEDSPPILVSNTSWVSKIDAGADWASPTLDDSGWARVDSIGAPGSKKDFLQWNADAGLYDWPGYSGILALLKTFRLDPAKVEQTSTPGEVLVDFGREVVGRVHLVSSSDAVMKVETSYGESAEEAEHAPFLGVRTVTLPAHGEAFGPKSAFRYVKLTAQDGGRLGLVKADVQGITYPVEYRGSFESSDALLNRIWETGAYTARLCMQDDIWDAPKRDRGRWMGDLDVSGRVINDVFADRDLMKSTMTALIADSHMPVDRDVNTLAGYSAFWVTGQAEFYRHTGDIQYLRSMQPRLLSLLHFMDGELDADALFTNPGKHKMFVDWSHGLGVGEDTPDMRAATHLEFYLAYQQAAYLLRELGDDTDAKKYVSNAERMRAAAQAHLVDSSTGTFGSRWQTNAMAVLSGAADPAQQKAIWDKVLSCIQPAMAGPENDHPADTITPYYGYYVLAAMAKLNHREEALKWMRQYWGGMLDEGATSFWEAYDPRWPKQDFHAHLQADNKEGYYVSLAHGWSAGPTAWLMDEVLGIQPTTEGFREVTIRPDLAGLQWVRGAEPTPRGLIRVEAKAGEVRVTIPAGTTANISLPFRGVRENGRAVKTEVSENGARSVVVLNTAGDYVFTGQEERAQ